jgi:hypothetical protein
MELIRVPRPPAGAFHKERRISDLIRAQVNHLKHVEQKLTAEQRRSIPQRGVTTEGEAAQYIAAMTAVLRRRPIAASSPGAPASSALRLVASPAAPDPGGKDTK